MRSRSRRKRPEPVSHQRERAVQRLVDDGCDADLGVEARVEAAHGAVERVEVVGEPDGALGIVEQRAHAGGAAERGVDRPEVAGGGLEIVATGGRVGDAARQVGPGGGDQIGQPGELRREPVGGAAEDRHDAAHETRDPTAAPGRGFLDAR